MKRLGVLGLMVLLITVIGCSSSNEPKASGESPSAPTASGSAPATQPSESQEPVKITFVQDFPQPAWGAQIPWIVAQEKGFYKEAGLEVEMVWPPTPPDPMKFVATGKAEMSVSYTPDILTGAAQGLEVKAVASLMDQDNGGIMFWEDEVKTPKDLEGKTVAIYDFPMTRLHFQIFMKHHGLDPDKIKTVSAGDFMAPLMMAGKVAGGDATFSSDKPLVETESKKKTTFYLYDESNGIPQRYWFVMIANPKFAAENPEAVKKFVDATFKGYNYAKENPDEAAEIFGKVYPDIGKEMSAKYWDGMKPSFVKFQPDQPEGYMDPAIWKSYMKFLLDNKLLEKEVDVDEIISNDFLPSGK